MTPTYLTEEEMISYGVLFHALPSTSLPSGKVTTIGDFSLAIL